MDWNDKSLKILSLTKTEIRILNVLDFPKTVQEIAQDSKVSRTGINHVLKHLSRKGLIKYELIGKRKKYFGINLLELSQYFQKTLDQIEISNKQKRGVRIKVSQEDEFVIHVGSKEIISVFTRIAFENKNERIKAVQHHGSFKDQVETATSVQISRFNQAIIKNNLIIEGILNESAYKSYFDEIKADPKKVKEAIETLGGRMADYSVFPDNKFNYHAEIWIFKTTTLIINWKKKVAIEIINSDITNFIREMYEYVKDNSKKINHNEMMSKLMEKTVAKE